MTSNILLKADLSNLETFFSHLTKDDAVKAKTVFYKKLSLLAHGFYNGKISTVPKVALPSLNWLNVWYTPGVSSVSTAIRDDNANSFKLSNRNNLVAVVSDSTRVLGDGDCTPPGGLGVMEGKAYLMWLLGGVDAMPLCIDSTGEDGKKSAQKIIDFVLAAQPSFGAVNLEDISQPNCYKVLDTLREKAKIPVWHDDAQGTACILAAGLINALKLAEKKVENVKIVFFGAGAANTTAANLIIKMGANPANVILIDEHGPLNSNREDLKNNPDFYKQWALAKSTNPANISDIPSCIKGADVLIALSKPGPDTIKKEWVSSMASKAIVFTCANPVPEIYPHAAHEAGAFITATGRGDFANQLNNSVCFPAILKGVLLCGATAISDGMAIACAKAIADFAAKRGITPDNIVPSMKEEDVFPAQAAAVAEQAIKEGLATINITPQQVYDITKRDIAQKKMIYETLTKTGLIAQPPQEIIDTALAQTLAEFK
ncbi:malate dehydrogenase (oxaloacetate-decarboxylating) [Elusimicrobium posterum]|uniref:NAD(P)-dependent malic enzyme n=1 Tax=Elusimicrobium posterum TaxID=3116653 RepID=UPI003C72DA44